MKILLIGGTGTISSAITRQLSAAGHDLWLINRGNRKNEVPANVRQVIVDIDDTDEVLRLLGDEQFDAVMENKSKYQLSRLLALTVGADGANPNVGQLSGNSPQPFIDELMALAKQFSGETGVPLNSLGIVQDNPASAEAIQAAREDICLVAERDMESDKPTLRRVCRAALAVESNTTSDKVDADVLVRFEQPLLNSMSARADWATKVSSVRPGFGDTDVAARMMGIDEADLPSIKSDEARAASAAAINAMFGGGEDANTA